MPNAITLKHVQRPGVRRERASPRHLRVDRSPRGGESRPDRSWRDRERAGRNGNARLRGCARARVGVRRRSRRRRPSFLRRDDSARHAGSGFGLPAAAVPIGFGPAGMPLGMQLIAVAATRQPRVHLGRAYQLPPMASGASPPSDRDRPREVIDDQRDPACDDSLGERQGMRDARRRR